MSLLYRATRKAHHPTGKLHTWAAEYCFSRVDALSGANAVTPWSSGSAAFRMQFTQEQLASQEMLTRFAQGGTAFLPAQYGVALDERCVEWPWAIANMGDAVRVLDAGSALNHSHILSLPVWKRRKLDILTLAPESICEWQRGISYQFADLRRMPYRDQEFDLIISISTLEHVGMDNTSFSGQERHKEHATGDLLFVLDEWRRVLKPGGRLLLTVPYGRYEDHGTFQQFDEELLQHCIQRFAPAKRQDIFFLYTEKGWQAVEQTACAEAVYAINAPKALEPDRAAAARAVTCCQWWR